MKTTLVIDDGVFRRIREEAVRQGKTISELVEAALRLLLARVPERPELPPLPSFDGGGFLVDVSDREALAETLERD